MGRYLWFFRAFGALAAGRFSSYVYFIAGVPAGAQVLSRAEFESLTVYLTLLPFLQIMLDHGGALSAASYCQREGEGGLWAAVTSGKVLSFIALSCVSSGYLYSGAVAHPEEVLLGGMLWMAICILNCQWLFIFKGDLTFSAFSAFCGRFASVGALYLALWLHADMTLLYFLLLFLAGPLISACFEFRRGLRRVAPTPFFCLVRGARFLVGERRVFFAEASPSLYSYVPMLVAPTVLSAAEFIDLFCAARVGSVVAAFFQLTGKALLARASLIRHHWLWVTAAASVSYGAAAFVVSANSQQIYRLLSFDGVTSPASVNMLALLLTGIVMAGAAGVVIHTFGVGFRLLDELSREVVALCLFGAAACVGLLYVAGVWGLALGLSGVRMALLVLVLAFAYRYSPYRRHHAESQTQC